MNRCHLTVCFTFVALEMFSKGGQANWVGAFGSQIVPLALFEVGARLLLLTHSTHVASDLHGPQLCKSASTKMSEASIRRCARLVL